MATTTQGRERLERMLLLLSSQAAVRTRREAPPRGRAARRLRQSEQPSVARPPVEPAPVAAPSGAAATATATPPPPEPQAPPVEAGPLIVELPELDELLDRLDRLEGLMEKFSPHRPLPATRDIFAEWVRLRRWEEMPFGEFLTLRRAGKI